MCKLWLAAATEIEVCVLSIYVFHAHMGAPQWKKINNREKKRFTNVCQEHSKNKRNEHNLRHSYCRKLRG